MAFKGLITTILVLSVISSFTTMANENENALKAIAKSNTEFTSSLYSALAKANEGNLIFSPYSLSAVMAMVKAGARGSTATDIQTALKFPSDDVLNKGYNELINSLKSDGENFTLETANKIYTQEGFELKSEFTDVVEKYYGAKVKQLDFSKSEESAKEINTFVSTTTHDKIKDLISPSDLDSLTRLVLVNAIYFKGLWKNKFNPQLTRDGDFHLDALNTVKVKMMKIETELPYGEIEELDAKVVALPYKGDRLSMIILLPNQIDGLKDMEMRLQNFSLASIPSRLREVKINLAMPKFTLESTIDLQGPLTSLGAGSMFDQTKADFSGIPKSKTDLYVSKAVQKAFIEVNEEGSEAAAATGIQISVKSGFGGPRMMVNHPFISMIIEDNTSSVLFHSTYADPKMTATVLKTSMWTSDETPKRLSGQAALLLPSVVLMPSLTVVFTYRVFY